MNEKHIGGDFDAFLNDEGIFEEVETAATKAVIAFQIGREMSRRGLTKSEMAERMGTSRAALDRLLDPANHSVTLATLERAATAVGMRLKIELTA